jgi:saccharopine dehydrogenase-like NADP-dependent oxidoreductase
MHKVLLLGAGKIGRMIANLLKSSDDYDLLAADAEPAALAKLKNQTDVAVAPVDASNPAQLASLMQGRQAVVSALSYYYNPTVAQAARDAVLSYFDLTEDIETTRRVREVAEGARAGQVFMPQCGLAPGFVSIAAWHLTSHFDSLDAVQMRVGALPQFPTNDLNYNLTWSTDGLINEYSNPCEAIHDGRLQEVLPLEGYEHFSLDGVVYEAFNTSGGLGSLCETLEGRVRELNYKTIRYPGHRNLAAFLLNDLRLKERRDLLKEILERAVPVTFQDVVIVFCTVAGQRGSQYVQISDLRKLYPRSIEGESWSAIQLSTAAGLCATLDLHFGGKLPTSGFIRQEQTRLARRRRGMNEHGRTIAIARAPGDFAAEGRCSRQSLPRRRRRDVDFAIANRRKATRRVSSGDRRRRAPGDSRRREGVSPLARCSGAAARGSRSPHWRRVAPAQARSRRAGRA